MPNIPGQQLARDKAAFTEEVTFKLGSKEQGGCGMVVHIWNPRIWGRDEEGNSNLEPTFQATLG